jgi:peroxiredoxin
MKTILAIAIAAALPCAALASAVVGQGAPDFTATDLAGKPVNFADFKGKTVVLEWHNPGCPFVQKHYNSGNMQSLQKKYGNDVVWLAVNSTNTGAPDYQSPEKLSALMKDFKAAPADYLMDASGKVGKAYGAKTTPHMYIIDKDGTLLYNGAIDDKRSTNVEDVKTAKNHVAVALEEIKAGKPVSTPSTTPYGCSVKY